MAFTLPKLQSRLPIVDSLGKPLDYFLRFLNVDFSGAIERNERNQAALLAEIQQTQADLAAQVLLLSRVLAGVEPFTAINVGGSTIAENGGLADGVVNTPTIATEAVTSSDADYVVGPINGITTSTITLASVTVAVQAGYRVDLIGNCSVTSQGGTVGGPVGSQAQFGTLFIYRNGVPLLDSERYGAYVIRGISQGVSAVTTVSDFPGTGTFTYTMVSILSGTTDVTLYNLSNNYLVANTVRR